MLEVLKLVTICDQFTIAADYVIYLCHYILYFGGYLL